MGPPLLAEAKKRVMIEYFTASRVTICLKAKAMPDVDVRVSAASRSDIISFYQLPLISRCSLKPDLTFLLTLKRQSSKLNQDVWSCLKAESTTEARYTG